MKRKGRLIAAVVMLLVALVSYYGKRRKNPVTGESQSIALSEKQEVALGLQAAPQMARKFGGSDRDAAAQALVDEVGGKLVMSGPARESAYRFEFTLLADDKTVNAFALPGGPVFITRALFARLSTEAELAGVLGHEVGHVLGRHAAERLAKSQLGQQIVGAVGVATSDEHGRGGGLAQLATQAVVQMTQMRYGREDELQSDALGVRFMADAGYDPRALIQVMKVLADSSGGKRPPEFMSTHPDPGDRAGKIEAEIAKRFPGGVPASLTAGRALRASAAPARPGSRARD
jgi:beta-barrel assembly-enhancing protease